MDVANRAACEPPHTRALSRLSPTYLAATQGVTRPSGETVNASPGSVPDPGVGTISLRGTSFAKTLRVAAPVGFSSQAFPSLTRMA